MQPFGPTNTGNLSAFLYNVVLADTELTPSNFLGYTLVAFLFFGFYLTIFSVLYFLPILMGHVAGRVLRRIKAKKRGVPLAKIDAESKTLPVVLIYLYSYFLATAMAFFALAVFSFPIAYFEVFNKTESAEPFYEAIAMLSFIAIGIAPSVTALLLSANLAFTRIPKYRQKKATRTMASFNQKQ